MLQYDSVGVSGTLYAHIFPAIPIAFDAGRLLLVSICRKVGNGSFASDTGSDIAVTVGMILREPSFKVAYRSGPFLDPVSEIFSNELGIAEALKWAVEGQGSG